MKNSIIFGIFFSNIIIEVLKSTLHPKTFTVSLLKSQPTLHNAGYAVDIKFLCRTASFCHLYTPRHKSMK